MFEKIEWEEVFDAWKKVCNELWNGGAFSELMNPPKAQQVLIPMTEGLTKQGIYIKGYNWLPQKDLDKHIEYVVNKPDEWLLFGSSGSSKGTIQTAEYLCEAKDSEAVSAVWIYACLTELHRRMPDEWRGEVYRILSKIERAANEYLFKDNIRWHHAMRDLIPHRILSCEFLSSFKPTSVKAMLELCAVICKTLLGTYKIIHYDTDRAGGKSKGLIAVDQTGSIQYKEMTKELEDD